MLDAWSSMENLNHDRVLCLCMSLGCAVCNQNLLACSGHICWLKVNFAALTAPGWPN